MDTKIPKAQYQQYMASKEWKAKRREFLDSPLYPNECFICSKPWDKMFHIHHVTYERFMNESLEDLRSVCESCHAAIHDLEKNHGFSLRGATIEARHRFLNRIGRTNSVFVSALPQKLPKTPALLNKRKQKKKPHIDGKFCKVCKAHSPDLISTSIGLLHEKCKRKLERQAVKMKLPLRL